MSKLQASASNSFSGTPSFTLVTKPTCIVYSDSIDLDKKNTNSIGIVTVSNRPKQLLRLADQVIQQQTINNKIHIIILDGITPEEKDIQGLAEIYAENNIQFKLISYPKDEERYLFEKLSYLRNRGIFDHLPSDILAFALWDDDNEWRSDHLASLFQALQLGEYVAAYSWRELRDADGKPHPISADEYPWGPNPRAKKAMYQLQKQNGILKDGECKIYDRYAYPSDAPVKKQGCCVDTGEWLFNYAQFKIYQLSFIESFTPDNLAFGFTDDQLLGLLMLEKGITEQQVICTKKHTLFYYLGGSSQEPKADLLPLEITAPLMSNPPTALDILALQGVELNSGELKRIQRQISKSDWLSIQTSMLELGHDCRTPLFPAPVARIKPDADWKLPAEFEEKGHPIFLQSPLASTLTLEDQKVLNSKLYFIDWCAVGRIVEPEIRKKLNLKAEIGLSINVFGSLLWKKPGVTAGDLDIVAIIETDSELVNVGSPVLNFECKGLTDLLPVGSNRVDLSVLGRGALCKQMGHSGDLTNAALWSYLHGVCVKGNPAILACSDQNIIQDIFTSLGFCFKAVTLKPNPKLLNPIIRGLQSLIYLAKKYQKTEDSETLSKKLEDISLWQQQLIEKSGDSSTFKAKFHEESDYLKEQAEKMHILVKQKAIELVSPKISSGANTSSSLYQNYEPEVEKDKPLSAPPVSPTSVLTRTISFDIQLM